MELIDFRSEGKLGKGGQEFFLWSLGDTGQFNLKIYVMRMRQNGKQQYIAPVPRDLLLL